MKKPQEQMIEQLGWMDATAHGGRGASLDIAIGDHEKFPGSFWTEAEQHGLTTAEIIRRGGFYRGVNVSGIKGKAERPLNIYFMDGNTEAQSWIMIEDLTHEQCNFVAGSRTAMIVRTSPGSHHLFLATSRPVTSAERNRCQQALTDLYGVGDKDSIDGVHHGRLAGFKNTKANRDLPWVNLISAVLTDRRADVDKLLARQVDSVASLLPPGGAASSGLNLPMPEGVAGTHKLSLSPVSSSHSSLGRDPDDAREFGWALGWLRKGLSQAEGIRRLSDRATDRGRQFALIYAAKTFANAAKKL